ncbi:uncharacterized protein Z518_03249 [Rhinocladiella mackenziei CBS 650.93]|uniref:Uncharacterized protein n=1 Tax=Rhinocladiella mackenziei CBS 650.93 TaxID=1442369 RepID=A0A0D2HDJ1_9EURO|nr:uncharacterized protein Z518_03249 [Rhinocladiella mackenziei CBS 650.93]KIX08593.1 hypothetical protein Z518_03249 [Rhinocladiella mackenziei CBS 650.93]
MPVSLGSESERIQSTQHLPTIPTVMEMESWDGEKLLRWIKRQNHSFFAKDDLERLPFQGINFLAANYKFFHDICHLYPLASLGPERLVNQVRKGELSNQAAGQKRKADAHEEPPISPKRYRFEKLTSELAIAAREQRKHVKDAIADIKCSADQLSNSVDPLEAVG